MAHIKWIKMWLTHRSQFNFKWCLIECIFIRIFQQPVLVLALLSLINDLKRNTTSNKRCKLYEYGGEKIYELWKEQFTDRDWSELLGKPRAIRLFAFDRAKCVVLHYPSNKWHSGHMRRTLFWRKSALKKSEVHYTLSLEYWLPDMILCG